MAVLALRLSAIANAVSQLHAKVSRRLWLELLPELADVDVRIRVDHQRRAPRRPGRSRRSRCCGSSENPDAVDRAEFWRAHEGLRGRLVAFCRERLAAERREAGAPGGGSWKPPGAFSTREALTIGFARRFATYKRATLLFHDPERLERILDRGPSSSSSPARPTRTTIPARSSCARSRDSAERPEFRGRVVFLPDYDMGARAGARRRMRRLAEQPDPAARSLAAPRG